MEIPVYLFTGLLESGKTTLIHEVAAEEGFLEPGRTPYPDRGRRGGFQRGIFKKI